MSKQPYIPLYIGDWEQDTNCLTPLAEFALLKLVFKLFKSEKKGVFVANYRTLSVLFKSNIEETKAIFQELIDNNILNISAIKEDTFEIISRRMIREGTISEIRSAIGKSGGKAKRKQNVSKREAKVKQNTDNDIDIVIDNIIEYLNKKVSKNFEKTTKETINLITAKIKSGYSENDLKKVIDIKTSQWLNDPNMVGYLRPSTLFGNKFESYLNETPIKKMGGLCR